MFSHRDRNRSWLAALTLLLVAGSAMLAAPADVAFARGARGAGPELSPIDGASMMAPQSAPSAPTPLQVVSASATPLLVSRAIDGAQGGVVTAGRFSVIVPPGAYIGSGTVTISVPNQTTLSCDLSITPADRNSFAIPVTLTVDCTGAQTANPYTIKVGYFDPALARWVPVTGSQEDNLTLRVSAPLNHFSKYGCFDSKAGW